MKILYLTTPSYFDLEISYIRELSKLAEVKIIMFVAPICMKSSAFSLDKIMNRVDIISALDYPGMDKYDYMINRSQWYIANDITNFSIRTSFILSKKIKAFVNNFKPDIIHNTSVGALSMMLTPMLGKRIPKILSIHDVVSHDDTKSMKSRIKDFLMKGLIGNYHNILLYSKISDDIIEKRLGKLPHKLYHSTLGPYDFLRNYPEEENKYGKYVLFFGRIDYYKGVDVLIEAYKNSELRHLGVKLVVAGKDLIHVTDEIDDESIIVLNRYIENDELANLIRHCLFVVLPYRTATQSGVTKSSFALNKPILCTDAGNLPQEVIDDKYGKVVKAGDAIDLSKGLSWMGQHEAELKRFSNNIEADWNSTGSNSWSVIIKEMYENVYLGLGKPE